MATAEAAGWSGAAVRPCGLRAKGKELDMSYEITVRKDGTEEFFVASRDRDERRFATAMFGQSADLKRKAWSTALEMSGVR